MRAVLAMMLVASTARADSPNSNDIVGRSIVLGRGELAGDATIAMNMNARSRFEPTSLSPDAWFGVTPRLTLGLVHSSRSVNEIDPDRTLCVKACNADYAGGIDARYAVHRLVAPRVRLLLRDTDPMKPAVTFGALARWHRDRFAITTDPYLRVGLANTDRGNRAALNIPVWLAVQPTCKWMVALRVGYDSAIAVARDGWRGPVGFIAGVHPIEPLDITVELGYRSLIGPQHEYRERALMITATWRYQGSAARSGAATGAAPGSPAVRSRGM